MQTWKNTRRRQLRRDSFSNARSQPVVPAVCSHVTAGIPDRSPPPNLGTEVPRLQTPSEPQHVTLAAGSPPLPSAVARIWESFVLDLAHRGHTEVHLMVPLLIAALSERGIASLRPSEQRRRHLERWRDGLKSELNKIEQAKPQAGSSSLQDGFRALDVGRSMPQDAAGADTTYQLTHASVLIFLQSELAAHKQAVVAQMLVTANPSVHLRRSGLAIAGRV